LATRLDCLSEGQRDQPVADALAGTGPDERELAALGPAVIHLSPPQKEALLAAAVGLDRPEFMLKVLVGLHLLLDDLNDEQFARVERAFACLSDDGKIFTFELPELSSIMTHLSEERCDSLINAISRSTGRSTMTRSFLEAARAMAVARDWQP
jgi:hypothetical protein